MRWLSDAMPPPGGRSINPSIRPELSKTDLTVDAASITGELERQIISALAYLFRRKFSAGMLTMASPMLPRRKIKILAGMGADCLAPGVTVSDRIFIWSLWGLISLASACYEFE